MRTPFLQRRTSIVGQKQDKPKALDKPPYATAPRSRNIPDDDPKPRVNANYKKPPKQLMERHMAVVWWSVVSSSAYLTKINSQ